MESMRYSDFVLHFETSATGDFVVRVLDSPAGEGYAKLGKDLSAGESVRILAALALGSEDGDEGTTETLGANLFSSLFSGQVRHLYEMSLGTLRREEHEALRIVLRLDPADRHLAFLYKIPWEALFNEDRREFVSLSRTQSIIRRLQVPRPVGVLPVDGTLRILLVVSEPEGLPPLDLAAERAHIESAFNGQPGICVSVLTHATTWELRNRLVAEEFHIIHFMGHGAFQPNSGEGALLLEDEQGRPVAVSGRELASILADCGSVRLAFLNACDTASATADDRANPFAGVATSLILGGVPVVVAMQFPISDEAAMSFSASFYRRLVCGDPVDAAVTEGRLALRMSHTGRKEWLAPALFSRVAGAPILRDKSNHSTTGPMPRNPKNDDQSPAKVLKTVMLEHDGIQVPRAVTIEGSDIKVPKTARPEEDREEVSSADRTYAESTKKSTTGAFEGIQSYTTAVLRQVEISYEEARKDARIWSVASLGAAGLGLGMVIAALIGLFLSNREVGVISGVVGVISGAVSGLFFRQWRTASARLAVMVDDLAELRKLDFAQHVAQTMETAVERDRAKSVIIAALVNTSGSGNKKHSGSTQNAF